MGSEAKLLGVPLVTLLGAARQSIAVYASGGFTSYSVAELQKQLGDWAAAQAFAALGVTSTDFARR